MGTKADKTALRNVQVRKHKNELLK